MKTIKEIEREFDKKLTIDAIDDKEIEYRVLSVNTPEDIKQFYRQAIKEILEEVVGDDKKYYESQGMEEPNSEVAGYNEAKAEIRARAAKILGE
jgi:hypothetical protein